MDTGYLDYSVVLSDLESQLTAIDAEAARIEAKRNVLRQMVENTKHLIELNSGSVESSPVTTINTESVELPENEYKGMTIADATIKYLEKMGRPKTTREVIAALMKGGLDTKSNTIDTTIRSSLTRERKKPNTRLTWEDGRWGLMAWRVSEQNEQGLNTSLARIDNNVHAFHARR